VVASVLYSMPFVVQPLQQAFEAIPERTLEAAATLRAGPLGPLLHRGPAAGAAGLVTASVLGFAHTVGEFGVVLMIGGNIPGRDPGAVGGASTSMSKPAEFDDAHRLAAGMVAFALVVLVSAVPGQPAATRDRADGAAR
jgi:molybdate transport system permease protein